MKYTILRSSKLPHRSRIHEYDIPAMWMEWNWSHARIQWTADQTHKPHHSM